jgi:uncharacterized membrane protein
MSESAPPPPDSQQPPPPPGPGAGAEPAAPPPAGKTNTLAIVALIVSIVQCVPIISPIAALILGYMARKQIKERGEGGDVLAIIAMILGALGLVLWVLAIVTGGLSVIFGTA